MNLFIYMEKYKKHLFSFIGSNINSSIEDVENSIRHNSQFVINRNEEGKIHSRYLGDRYEPAIIFNMGTRKQYFYLFDGDIKDCLHPFSVICGSGRVLFALYYSSERIINTEPVCMCGYSSYYNMYDDEIILDGYYSEQVGRKNTFENFTLLCDEMQFTD